MKRLLLSIVVGFLLFFSPSPIHASSGFTEDLATSISLAITGYRGNCGDIAKGVPQNRLKYLSGECDENGVKAGFLPQAGNMVAFLYDNQISSREYIADIFNNMGVPSVGSAFAQSTSAGSGYDALSPFLPFWKVFRNLAYSLYIIMFIVIGIMIMLRTKVNAQTIITIQSALPNLLITLILITFSYAIVGFMVDLMYFLIYFVVFLVSTSGIITDAPKVIDRFMTYSAWSVIFEGRNSIISAVSYSMQEIFRGIGEGGLEVVGDAATLVTKLGIGYLVVAVAFAIAMLKLMWTLLKSYVMLLVQTITAPVQILLNAMPGSKAFSGWLKKTASYLIPFPVTAAMLIFSAILVGNPADKTIHGKIVTAINPNAINNDLQEDNPFGVDQSNPIYQESGIWMPPFLLTTSNIGNTDVLTIIGFFVFLMTPAAAKMAQDWLQVKESPYISEAMGNLGAGWGAAQYPVGIIGGIKRQAEQRKLMQDQAQWIGRAVTKDRTTQKPG